MKKQEKPYIICHILTSINGKITGSFFGKPETKAGGKFYQKMHDEFKADAVAYGRTTIEEVFTKGRQPDLSAYQGIRADREDYAAATDSPYYLVSVDPEGGLSWNGPTVQGRGPGYDGAHIIEVLTEKTPDEYLAYLKKQQISYIFAGKERLDVNLAAEKLFRIFGIRRMLLQGGGVTNGTFAGLIDELSLVVVPVTECGSGNPTAFEAFPFMTGEMSYVWKLNKISTFEDSVVWMRYIKE